jgi:hypothetical protein
MTISHNYAGNFEVHLTVRAAGMLDAFRSWCEAQHFKCVYIVLARGAHHEQPMATWRRDSTVLPVVLAEALQRADALERGGFAVVRVKIEVEPANADVPANDSAAQLHPPGNYFEHHIKLRRQLAGQRESLLRLCVNHGAHLSRNAWREPAEGFEERFVTLRSYGSGRSVSAERLEGLRAALKESGEEIIEVESEYAVYDSNQALDAGWLPHGPS